MRLGLKLGLKSGRPRWTPARLFADGTAGAWFDPSDTATTFQDSGGTIPAGIGDPVGLLVDKSQHLGPEIFSNQIPSISNFAGSAGRYSASTRTMHNDAISSSDSYPRFIFDLGLTTGKRYEVYGRLDGDRHAIGPSLEQRIRLASSGSNNPVGYDPLTGIFRASQVAGGPAMEFQLDGTKISSITIAAISVKELPGNHAAQETSRSKPILRADTGGRRYLEFDGVDDVLPSDLPATATESYSTSTSATTTAAKTLGTNYPLPAGFFGYVAAAKTLSETDRQYLERFLARKAGVTL